MKTTYGKLNGILLTALFAGCATTSVETAPEAETGKNCCTAVYRAVPADPAEAMRTTDWNFNFRPYGKSASEWLVSDPKVQRDAANGADTGKSVTGVSVACDAEGFTVLVLCTDPALAEAYSKTNATPSPCIEIFVMTGDSDTETVTPHNMTSGTMSDMREYTDIVQDRDTRYVRPYMTCVEDVTENGFLCRIRYDWEAFRDRLPVFSDRRDNLWRLSVIRWVDGGRTWGGPVHQISQAGYVRWPAFTPEQRTAILAATLRKGWAKFNAFIRTPEITFDNSYTDPTGWIIAWKETERLAGRSYVNENEDPAFRPEMLRLIAEGKALAPKLAAFPKMAEDEQVAFYAFAQDKLFNIGYDMKRAYGRYEEERIFKSK